MTYKQRDKFVADLREFADFIEKNGQKLPLGEWDTRINVSTYVYDDDDKGTALQQLKNAVKVLGKAEKNHNMYSFDVTRKFGSITLGFSVPREKVCEKVVIETINHEEKVVPAWTEEKVEWKCNDSLLAAADLA